MDIPVKGNRTIVVGLALIGYLVYSHYSGIEADQKVIMGLVAGMGIFLRLGMNGTSSPSCSSSTPSTPSTPST